MKRLNLPDSVIGRIVDDPSILASRFSTSSNRLEKMGVTLADADAIIAGYASGFKTVFILNACFAALATIISVLMIRHKELIRPDEEQLKAEAKLAYDLEKAKTAKGEDR